MQEPAVQEVSDDEIPDVKEPIQNATVIESLKPGGL